MKKLLMIMTSHRLDCLKINLSMHKVNGSLDFFDKIVFLLNGVTGKHLDYVNQFMADHPQYDWDTVPGPRGRGERISSLENQCVERYPGYLYMKTDEDVFVGKDWASSMYSAWEHFKDNDKLAVITPLVPNQSIGLHQLLTVCYPEKQKAFQERFGHDPDPSSHGSTWYNPYIGGWATQEFISLNKVNQQHLQRMKEQQIERFHTFHHPFTVCCICFDYRHWENMGGIPKLDEPEWCKWIEERQHINVVDRNNIALHYSYYLQQDWLDRTHILEDIIRENLPEQWNGNTLKEYVLPRMQRIAKQLPRATVRKTKHLLGKN